MTSERWELVTRIFDAALELPQSARGSFVHRECQGDPALEAEVIKLLAADEQAGSFLEHPAVSTLPRHGVLQVDQSLPAIAAGTVVSERFEILRLIGQGGMGQVYEALDLELNARVALKAIRPDISSDPRMLSRFRREVQLTRRITHPNVCRTFDIERHSSTAADGSSSDLTFLTMELLEGETLADLLRRHRRLTIAEAHPLIVQMIDALSAAHAAGIIHRDFKPSNVLLVPASVRASGSASSASSSSKGDGIKNGTENETEKLRVVVTDFGLARALLPQASPGGQVSPEHAATSLTGNPALMGTLIYMAPEQFERGEASVASDIYSLGLVIYEMLAGARPFADPIPFAEAAKRLKHPAPPAKSLVPDIPLAWDAAISQCLEIEAGKRFETVQDLAEALAVAAVIAARGARSSGWSRTTEEYRLPFKGSQNRRLAAIIVCVLMLVSLLGITLRYYIEWQNPIHLAARDWILVTDFDNQTGEKIFDRVVRDLTVQSLSQSTYLDIVPRLTAIEAAKRAGLQDAGFIDERMGHDLCLRENYKALVTGQILKGKSGYTIRVKAETPGHKVTAVTQTETIQSTDEIFPAIDRIATRLRQSLGEPLSLIENSTRTLKQVTTPSVEALQRYSMAVDLYGAREYERSINLAKDAIERDPHFAMAYLLLGRSYEQIGRDALASAEFERARTYSSQASEREKFIIMAAKYSADLQNDKASQEYQHLLDIYPDDVDSLRHFAISTYYAGYPERAIVAQKRALALSPRDPGCYDYLLELLVRTNRFSEALALFEQARSRKVETAGFRFLAALAAWGNGDLPRAQQLLEDSGRNGSGYTEAVDKLYLGKLFAFQGRMHDAAEVFRAGLTLARRPGSEDWGGVFHYQLAKVEMAEGEMEAAKKDAKQCADLFMQFSNTGGFEQAGSLAVDLMDLNSARQLSRLIGKQAKEHHDPLTEMEWDTLQGRIYLAQGHAAQAVIEERRAINLSKGYEPLFALGQACAHTRDWKCSIEAYSAYLQQKGAVLRDDAASDWVSANYQLARSYAEAGDIRKGIEYCQRFLGLWSSVDSQLPEVGRASRDMKRWRRMAN
jgi:serine/threonine protein kinase/tetratricopeptide (TPR) repeat protein